MPKKVWKNMSGLKGPSGQCVASDAHDKECKTIDSDRLFTSHKGGYPQLVYLDNSGSNLTVGPFRLQ